MEYSPYVLACLLYTSHFYSTHPGCLTQDIFNIKQTVIRFQKQAFIGDYLHRFIGIIFPKRKIKPFLQQLYRLLRFSTKAMPYPRSVSYTHLMACHSTVKDLSN